MSSMNSMSKEITNLLAAKQRAAIHAALRGLAGSDPDRARERNDVGYSKVDGCIGHSLSDTYTLSPRQAALGLRIIKKYHRQIPAAVYAVACPVPTPQEER